MSLEDEATLKLRRPVLAKTGSCYNCSNPIPMTDNFCEFECQQAYLRQIEHMEGKA